MASNVGRVAKTARIARLARIARISRLGMVDRVKRDCSPVLTRTSDYLAKGTSTGGMDYAKHRIVCSVLNRQLFPVICCLVKIKVSCCLSTMRTILKH